MATSRSRSASSRVFVTLVGCALLVAALVATLLAWDSQRASRHEAERVSQAISTTLSHSPKVRQQLELAKSGIANPAAVSDALQPLAAEVIEETDISYVTIMSPDGLRYTHRDPAQIGRNYLGTIPKSDEQFTEVYPGTLGPSIRVISPVLSDDRTTLLGWISAGVTLTTVGAAILEETPMIIAITIAIIAVGLTGALIGRRFTRGLTGDLSAADVREATSAYESVRTLAEAMRAQQHEYGNRLHTAVALLELGRTEQAIALLTERARQNQDLADDLTADATADDTMGALILGKTEQARELGIDLISDISPDTPQLGLDPVDAVSVVGNLLDNAFDAALSGTPPRVVHLTVGRSEAGGAQIDVSDSGPGFTAESRRRMFERGFSTKAGSPGDPERGIGLTLVREIIEQAGGSIVASDHPTTFRATFLPRNTPAAHGAARPDGGDPA